LHTWPGLPGSSPSRRPPCTTWPAWALPQASDSGWRSWPAFWRDGWQRCWPARRSRWPPTTGRRWTGSGPPSRTWERYCWPPRRRNPPPGPPRALAARHPRPNASQEPAAALPPACQGARTPGLGPAMPASVLTPREREVAMLAAMEASSREIATRLHLSIRTVDNHLGRIYAKLGVSSRPHLATLLEIGASRPVRGRMRRVPTEGKAPAGSKADTIGRSGGHTVRLHHHGCRQVRHRVRAALTEEGAEAQQRRRIDPRFLTRAHLSPPGRRRQTVRRHRRERPP